MTREIVNYDEFLSRKEVEELNTSTYPTKINNSTLEIKNFYGIHVEEFRTIRNQNFYVNIGVNLLSGYNGTMKSTILGLFTQGFNSDFQDLFGKPLRTKYSEIFNLSLKYDGGNKIYKFEYLIEDIHSNKLKIPVFTKVRDKNDPNSDVRIITGGRNQVDGNMNLATRYINLNRLLSIHTSDAKVSDITLSEEESERQKAFYNRIFSHKAYNSFDAVANDENKKYTFGPSNGTYDYTSISSGEDNLGSIFNALLSFERLAPKKDSIRGILCIDEVEASLHPAAQINLIEYLSKWGIKNKTIVILTTHSLGLIEHISKKKNANHYYFSNLYSQKSLVDVYLNPSYETVKEEMAYMIQNEEEEKSPPKINVLCEDEVAKFIINATIKTRDITKRIEFIKTENDNGIGFPQLISFYKKTKPLFDNQSLIFLDGDIDEKVLLDKAINPKDLSTAMTIIPGGEHNLCFESWITYDLFKKSNDDPVFRKLKKPASYFKDRFHSISHVTYDIFLNDPQNDMFSKICKNFISNTPEISKKYMREFIRSTKEFEDFRNLIIEKLNFIANKKGYPDFK
ncbi:AAA family ATPase [Exiguobacterium profundum]